MSDSTLGSLERCKERRAWYLLHVSTCCLLLPAAALLVLLVVPGDWVDTVRLGVGAWWGSERTFEHGWPGVYLRRSVVYPWDTGPEYPQSGIPWLFQPAWSFQGDSRELRPWILAIDVLAGLVLLGLVAAGAEWRRRRHRRFWQFSVGEMLAVMCLIATGLGWYQYNKQVYEREKKLASVDDWPKYRARLMSTIDYRGPLWLRRLAGERNLQGLRRVIGVNLGGERFGDEELKRRVEEIKTLSSLESLWIDGSGVSDAGLECLSKLPRLRILYLSSPSITDAGLAHVERLGALRELSLTGTGITSAGLKHLRELKHLESLSLQRTGIDDAGLAHLSGLENLRSLYLGGTKLNGSGLLHLKNLKNLEFVGMVGTPVKMEYVEELSDSLPKCYVATRIL